MTILAKVFQPHRDVVLFDGGVCIWSKNEAGLVEHHRIADYIDVISVTENIDSGNMSLELEYNDSTVDSDNKVKSVSLGDVATKQKILALAECGLDVNENNAKLVIKHIRNRREKAVKKFVHTNLGIFEKNQKSYFKSYKVIAAEEKEDQDSVYTGQFVLEPKGSEQKWLEMINNQVLERTELQLSLIAGFSAPVVGYIARELGIESLFIHYYGDSSKGKTTAAMLGVSPFGSPGFRDNGLMTTWNTTSNAMHGVIAGNNGIPMVFDESSMSNKRDFTREIYSLTSGREKARMDKECNIREQKLWSTTIISTGEHSILTKSKESTGLRMRLIELGNLEWTKDAKQSDIIKETVLENYGHMGILFVRKLLSLGKKEVIAIHKSCKDSLELKLQKTPFTERIASKLALLMVAARILKEYIEIDLNLEKIEDLLVNNENENFDDSNIADKAYDVLIQTVAENAAKFEKVSLKPNREAIPAKDHEVWGIIENYSKGGVNNYRLVIIVKRFEEIMITNGFEEPKIILKKLKDAGLLDCEKDKYTRRRKIGELEKVPCYVISFKRDEIGEVNPRIQCTTN